MSDSDQPSESNSLTPKQRLEPTNADILRASIETIHEREHAAFFLLLVPGAIVGAFGLLVVPVTVLYLALSGYIIVFLVSQRYESRAYQVAERPRYGMISGVATGILGGGFGAAGPPAVPYLYMHTRDYPRAVFIGGMAAAFVVPQIVRLPTLVVAGRFDPREYRSEHRPHRSRSWFPASPTHLA